MVTSDLQNRHRSYDQPELFQIETRYYPDERPAPLVSLSLMLHSPTTNHPLHYLSAMAAIQTHEALCRTRLGTRGQFEVEQLAVHHLLK